MKFKKVTDQNFSEIILQFDTIYNLPVCDFTPGTFFMWKEYYSFEYCRVENLGLFVRSKDAEGHHYFPPACTDFDAGIAAVIEQCAADGEQVSFSPVPEQLVARFMQVAPFAAHKMENWSDYIYNTVDFCALAGKKYHGKRNHIAKFDSTYTWRTEVISPENLPRVIEFLHAHGHGPSEFAAFEHEKTLKMLNNLHLFNTCGLILLADGKIIGFSLGEYIADTLCVHTEKADRSYSGVYEKLAHEFAMCFAAGGKATWLNREEDMGEPGLIAAKKSWGPAFLIDKFTLTL